MRASRSRPPTPDGTQLYAHAPVACVLLAPLTDGGWAVDALNPAACALLGVPEADALSFPALCAHGLVSAEACARVAGGAEPVRADTRLALPGRAALPLRTTLHSVGEGLALWLEAAPAATVAPAPSADLAALFGDAPLGLGLLGPDLTVRWANAALARLEGLGPGEAEGRPLGPALRPLFGPLVAGVLADGASLQQDLGPEAWGGLPDAGDWQAVAFPVAARGGQPGGVGVALMDISERKAAERGIAEREELLRLALETAGMVAWEWGREEARVRWSPNADAFFGLGAGGIGTSFEQFLLACVVREDRATVRDALAAAQATQGDGLTAQFRGPDAGGHTRCYEASAHLYRDEAGALQRMVGVVVDVTEREAQLERLARESEFRERFMGVLGHDLRTPLNAIVLCVRALRTATRGNTPAAGYLDRLEASARRMASMISDVLDVTRARLAGGIPLHLTGVSLPTLARTVLDELEAANPGRRVVLQAAGEVRGTWDPDRLAQVLSNLVGNALEHSPDDAEVRVTCEAAADRVALHVFNTGPAIPAELLPTLFEPFRSGPKKDDAEKKRGRRGSGGLGLGLYIVRELVRAHRGSVAVRSQEGDGTRFTVTLPLDARQAGAREAPSPPAQQQSPLPLGEGQGEGAP